MKLFGFGKSSEKRTAKVLGPNMSSLFGGEEGAEMIVEATESGLPAIEAAESRLEEFNQQVATLTQEKEAAEQALTEAASANETALNAEKEALATEQAAHKVTADAFEAFKADPGAEHTNVEKTSDDYNGQEPAKSKIRQEEEAALAQGKSIHTKTIK